MVKEFKSIAMHYAGCSSCWLRIVGFLFNLFPYWALFLMPMVIEFHSYDSKAADAESSKNYIFSQRNDLEIVEMSLRTTFLIEHNVTACFAQKQTSSIRLPL